MEPPNVSSWMINTSAPRRSAVSMPRLIYSNIGGMIGPSAVITMASGVSLCACTALNATERDAYNTIIKMKVWRRVFITCSPSSHHYNGYGGHHGYSNKRAYSQ